MLLTHALIREAMRLFRQVALPEDMLSDGWIRLAEVKGSKGTYLLGARVGQAEPQFVCTCPDHSFRHRYCKHQQALLCGDYEGMQVRPSGHLLRKVVHLCS